MPHRGERRWDPIHPLAGLLPGNDSTLKWDHSLKRKRGLFPPDIGPTLPQAQRPSQNLRRTPATKQDTTVQIQNVVTSSQKMQFAIRECAEQSVRLQPRLGLYMRPGLHATGRFRHARAHTRSAQERPGGTCKAHTSYRCVGNGPAGDADGAGVTAIETWSQIVLLVPKEER